jgi:hypothetical protein
MIAGAVPGNSLALETLETTFHQDLNGDGAIGIPSATQTATIHGGAAWTPRAVATTASPS